MTRYGEWRNANKAILDGFIADANGKKNKYNAKLVQVEGVWFDSKAEAKRFTELRLMQAAGLITNLLTHPVFPIEHNDQRICMVELDFKYFDLKRNQYVYEDVKSQGTNTALSVLKRKLVENFHRISVDLIGL